MNHPPILIACVAILTFTGTFATAQEEGIYIATGHGLHRVASNDGRTWTNHVFEGEPSHNQNDLAAIAVGNGVCVTVGGYFKSNIYVTDDGVNWQKPDFNIGVLSGVIFDGDRFLVFGQGGRVAESKDGLNWEKVGDAEARDYLKEEAEKLGLEKGIKSNIRMWAEANGVYVGAGDNSMIVSTDDLENWHFAERVEPHARLRLASNGERFVVGGKKNLYWSEDGKNWNLAAEIPMENEKDKFTDIDWDGERFIASTKETTWESPDGKSWTQLDVKEFPRFFSLIRPDLYYGFKNYWQETDKLLVSTDGGKTWEATEIPAPLGVTNVIHAPEIEKF